MKWILVLLSCLSLAYCQTTQQWQATLSETDPAIVGGILQGEMWYDYTNQRQKIQYNFGGSTVIEIILYASRLRYLLCGSTCDLETFNQPMPKFWNENTDTSVGTDTINGVSCTKYQKYQPVAGGLSFVWMGSNGLACQVQYMLDGTNTAGKVLTFTNMAALDPSVGFNDYLAFNCPKQTCNVQMDICLILDESGSIDPEEFSELRQFCLGVVTAYNVAPNAISIGIVMFATTAQTILNYSNNKQTVVNALNGVVQSTGSTCIACGLENANTMAETYGRPGVQKVYIFLTDGYNNQQLDALNAAINTAKNTIGAIIFTIGVDGYDEQQLDTIRTILPGVNTLFTVSQFNQLNTILANLTAATCLDIPGTPCGVSCVGFCGCKATCYCPSACSDGNACTNDTCIPGQNGDACQFLPITCDDNNACTDDSCDKTTGCVYTPHVCDDNNDCTNNTCSPATGCGYPTITCSDNDPCTVDTCNPSSGCVFTRVTPCDCAAVTCPPAAPCTTNPCNPANGQCDVHNVTCDDSNACTNDACDPTQGTNGACSFVPIPPCDDQNACTHDSCDPKTGCVFTPFNVPVDCDDRNNCTTDSCDKTTGCTHTPITCDDNNLCTNDGCLDYLGCTFQPVECSAAGNCSVALCDPSRGCYLEALPGHALDKCGVCDGNGSTCGGQLSTAAVAGLSAGILALIIIAAVAVCVALGIFGGKKGYDIWLRNQNGMGGAQKSPLYQDNNLSGTSPLYSGTPSGK
jgi:hypothetical protein